MKKRIYRGSGVVANLAATLGITNRHTSNLLNSGMPADANAAKKWRRYTFKKRRRDFQSGEWPIIAEIVYMIHEIQAHGKKKIYPDWSEIADREIRNKKQRGDCLGRWNQVYRQYWKAWEINAHSRRSVFPDWGCLAERYMENKRRDYSASYSRRRQNELRFKKEYRQRPEVKAAHAKRQREKCKSDPSWRVRKNLSKRMYEIMAGLQISKDSSVMKFIGCTLDELRRHIERQFKRGMTWQNYGTKWHVDHILPCASFDHTDKKQVAICWHWTNLRPLFAKENIAKKDKITIPQMSLKLDLCA